MHMIPNKPPPTMEHPEQWSPDLNDFLARCLTKDPALRPSAIELLTVFRGGDSFLIFFFHAAPVCACWFRDRERCPCRPHRRMPFHKRSAQEGQDGTAVIVLFHLYHKFPSSQQQEAKAKQRNNVKEESDDENDAGFSTMMVGDQEQDAGASFILADDCSSTMVTSSGQDDATRGGAAFIQSSGLLIARIHLTHALRRRRWGRLGNHADLQRPGGWAETFRFAGGYEASDHTCARWR